jgi:hypothetical protein
MKRREPIPARHFGPAAVAVEDYLRSLGCDDITFIKGKHVKVTAMVGPKRIGFSIPCTPRDDTAAAKQAVRQAKKKLTEACVAVA